jgi:hypothetical protein
LLGLRRLADPFALAGTWLRCALHAHTTNSDGELPPRMLVRHYEHAGFDVLAITDHWVRTDEPSTDRLLVVPSVELDARLDAPGHEAHVLAYGVAENPERPTDQFPTLAETITWVREHGGLPFLAHPYWSGLRASEFESADGVFGLEVYNAGCELEVGRGLSAVHWDDVLERGRPYFGIATDDSHHPGFDSGFAWVWLRAADRTPDAVLRALGEGAFYSSSGPKIDEIAVVDGAVEVRCSPARRITLLTGRGRGASVNAGRLGYAVGGEMLAESDGGGVTAARLRRPVRAPYGRVEVVGLHGGTAWTNPLWVS